MRTNEVREAWVAGRCAVNGWCSIGSPYGAEIFAAAGYDSVTIDLQHGMFGVDTAIGMLQAISAQAAAPMVRVPALDDAVIMKMLDAGAYGVICPMIDTPEQSAQLVAACRYPPVGVRSFGPSRGLLHGGPDYVEYANETVLAWAMIETTAGLSNVEAICATPGLDGIFIGPSDLASDLGSTIGEYPLPTPVDEAVDRIISATKAAGIAVGIFCKTEEMAIDMIGRGVNLVTVNTDAVMLRQSATQLLGRLSEAQGS